jgi:hypothetical protein
MEEQEVKQAASFLGIRILGLLTVATTLQVMAAVAAVAPHIHGVLLMSGTLVVLAAEVAQA